MHPYTLKTALLVASLTLCGYAAAGGRGATLVPPMIEKVAVDAKKNAIIITGWNFGSIPPYVRLSGQTLEVERASANKIVAQLPPGIQPATYGLTVTTSGQNKTISNHFSVALP